MNLGTGVPSMASSRLYSLKLVGVSAPILAKLDSILTPILQKVQRLQSENKVLSKLRDFLLPLLVKGQVQA